MKKMANIKKELTKFAFASLLSLKYIKAGEILLTENIWLKRTGKEDFTTNKYENLLRKTIKKNLKKNTQIKKTDLSE